MTQGAQYSDSPQASRPAQGGSLFFIAFIHSVAPASGRDIPGVCIFGSPGLGLGLR